MLFRSTFRLRQLDGPDISGQYHLFNGLSCCLLQMVRAVRCSSSSGLWALLPTPVPMAQTPPRLTSAPSGPRKVGKGPSGHKTTSTTGKASTILLPASQKSSVMFSQIWLAYFSQLYQPQKLKQLLFALGGGLSVSWICSEILFPVWCKDFIFVKMCVKA